MEQMQRKKMGRMYFKAARTNETLSEGSRGGGRTKRRVAESEAGGGRPIRAREDGGGRGRACYMTRSLCQVCVRCTPEAPQSIWELMGHKKVNVNTYQIALKRRHIYYPDVRGGSLKL